MALQTLSMPPNVEKALPMGSGRTWKHQPLCPTALLTEESTGTREMFFSGHTSISETLEIRTVIQVT